MRDVDTCGLPYVHNGDIAECRLDASHADACEDANHAADRIAQATRWNGPAA